MKRVFFLFYLGILLMAGCSPLPGVFYWARSYHFAENTWCSAVLKTDNEFIIAGNVGEAGGISCKFLIMKLDHDGNILWENSYHHSPYRQSTCIQEVKDKGKRYYFVAGYTFEQGNRAALVIKLDGQGKILWEKIYWDDQYHYIPSAMLNTEDGGVAIAGRIEEIKTNNQDFWVMKLMANGNIDWQKAYDYPYDPDGKGTRHANETATSIARTTTGGYLVAGNLLTPQFGYDPWIVELENNGDLKSQVRIQSSGDNNQVTSMVHISDPASKNMFGMTGFTNSGGDSSLNMFVVKLELAAGIQMKWHKAYEHSGPDYAYSIDQTTNGDLVLVGSGFTSTTNSLDALILRVTSSDGLVKWSIGYGDVQGGKALEDGFYSVHKTTVDGFVVGGYNNSFPATGFKNIWVMNLDKAGHIDKKKYHDSCMLFGIDVKQYVPDWVFQCLPGFKPVEVKDLSVVPKDIKSTVTPSGIGSLLLCP